MKRVILLFLSILIISALVIPQDVGSMAGAQTSGHFALRFSYENISRKYNYDTFREKVSRDIFKGTVSYSFSPWVNIYGFIGSSNFPHSLADIRRQVCYGGGLKFMLLGGEVFVDGYTKRTVHIKAGIGLDLRVGHLHSSGDLIYETFDLTEYQGAIDLGIKVFMVTCYFGFKMSWANGDLFLANSTNVHLRGRGCFSMFVGWDFDLTNFLALTSEFSFFTDKSWSLGLRMTI